MKSQLNQLTQSKRAFAYLIAITALALSAPIIMMQFNSGINWNISDFVLAAFLLLSMGSLFILLSRRFPSRQLFITVIVGLLLVYMWAELAIGIFTNLGS